MLFWPPEEVSLTRTIFVEECFQCFRIIHLAQVFLTLAGELNAVFIHKYSDSRELHTTPGELPILHGEILKMLGHVLGVREDDYIHCTPG